MMFDFFQRGGIAFEGFYQCAVLELCGFDVAMVAVAHICFETFNFLE